MPIPDHSDIRFVLAFIERHGYVLLFLWVLAEQSAIPLPSLPLLLAAGALIRAGRLALVPAILCCMLGALIADAIWFQLGRRRGRQVLRLVCRMSLEPDSCVRQTEGAFLKYGMRVMLFSKFIPGLNAVAAPLAGNSRGSYFRFACFDSAGALLWSGGYIAVGYLFSQQLETAIAYASRMGANLFFLLAFVLALWIAWKLVQRRRFLRQLAVARITPAELAQRLRGGEELFIVDMRSGPADEPSRIPGAVRIPLEELKANSERIPRDREIILFCS